MKRAAPNTINHALLPTRLRDLVRVLGERDAFELVMKRGGTRLIVPKKVSADHPLLEVLGLAGFVALVDAYGGEVIDDLPKHDSVTRQMRHERVRQIRAAGKTIDSVAVQTGYTRRQVFNILAADGPDERQQGLFDSPPDTPPEMPPEAEAEVGEAMVGRAHDPFGIGWRRS